MASVWLDGSLIAEEDAHVYPKNRGFLYGDGCFETVRIHGGAPFRLDAHFERLRDGLEVLRIEPPWSVADLRTGGRRDQRRRRGPRANDSHRRRARHHPGHGDDHDARPPGDSTATRAACRRHRAAIVRS